MYDKKGETTTKAICGFSRQFRNVCGLNREFARGECRRRRVLFATDDDDGKIENPFSLFFDRKIHHAPLPPLRTEFVPREIGNTRVYINTVHIIYTYMLFVLVYV